MLLVVPAGEAAGADETVEDEDDEPEVEEELNPPELTIRATGGSPTTNVSFSDNSSDP
jgi:hypothetical protein